MTLELMWPGKYVGGVRQREKAPPVHLEYVRSVGASTGAGILVIGDALAVAASLAKGPLCRLIYIDPPFGTGTTFRLSDGEMAFVDKRDAAELVAFLDARLALMRDLLADDGSLYVHLDPIASHAVKLLLDEHFGPNSYQREIIWRIGWVSGFKAAVRNWCRNHDSILFYTRKPSGFVFNKPIVPYPDDHKPRRGKPGALGGMPVDDVWNGSPAEHALAGAESLDSIQIKSLSTEKTGWPTQKNESLLRRIIAASSNPGDLVADLFCGSGTTLVAAHRLGRRWLGCDQSETAVNIAAKRLEEAGAAFTIYRSVPL